MTGLLGVCIIVLSVISAFMVAACLYRSSFFIYISERKNRCVALDGLRGYLALGVFFCHYLCLWNWQVRGAWLIDPAEDFVFINSGKIGVYVFFMITGYLFVEKIIVTPGRMDWVRLFQSRVFRIYPLYLFVVFVVVLISLIQSEFSLYTSVTDIFLQAFRWLLFEGVSINGYEHSYRITSGVQWTLKYEWIFYLSLPLISLVHGFGRLALALFFMVCIAVFKLGMLYGVNTQWIAFFVMGGVSAHIRHMGILDRFNIKGKKRYAFLAIICFLASLSYPFVDRVVSVNIMQMIMVFPFFVIVTQGNTLFGLLQLKPSVLLGELSYSIYLLHGAIIFMLFVVNSHLDISRFSELGFLLYMPMTTALVVLISTVTFLWIEKPGIELGKSYGRRKNTAEKVGLQASH